MTNKPKIALLTSCSVTRNFAPIVKISDAPIFDTMDELCEWWVEAHRHNSTQVDRLKTPGEIYAGVSFTTITEIAQGIGHKNIYIVTGGAGLSNHTTKIVPYDFTSDKGATHNVHQHVKGEKFIPHVWWEKINTHLQGNPTPIASLMNEYDCIVGALPKAFIKYIVQDLKAIDPVDLQSNVFIPIPRSMIGSIPKDVRAAFMPYGQAYISDIVCSRYNKAQKVVQKFLRECGTIEQMQEYALVITQEAIQSSLLSKEVEPTDYESMFASNPELLKAEDVVVAYRNAKILGLDVGSKLQFAGAWRGALGPIKVSVPKGGLKEAMACLDTMLAKSKPSLPLINEALLQQIGLFINAVEEAHPELVFQARDVAAWGRLLYPEDKYITKASKITRVLINYTKHLGLEIVNTGVVQGYRIAQ